MIIELHLLQNFAPSNLNRDENGAPKNCVFGGATRARISSQCLKRAARDMFKQERLLPPERLASRTLLLAKKVSDSLAAPGRDPETIRAVVTMTLTELGLAADKAEKKDVLLFLGAKEISRLTGVCDQYWDTLVPLSARPGADESSSKTSASDKKSKKKALPDDIVKALSDSLDGGKASDLALFGRMIANRADLNIEAASQVAHAISTHQVATEFDFYTAVDDLQSDEETGAGMMGTVEFNSACFYRYANVDLTQLTHNLGGDHELALQTLEAYIHATVGAIPSGKQNSMAAQNPPSLVMAVARERGLWSLANAFEKPVRAHDGSGLIESSVLRLDQQWRKLVTMYGAQGIRAVGVVCDDLDGGARLEALRQNRVGSVAALVAGMKAAVMAGVVA